MAPGGDASASGGDAGDAASVHTPHGPPLQHRATAAVCPPGDVFVIGDAGACTTNADCNDGGNGKSCLPVGDGGASHCNLDDCRADDDCPAQKVCACASTTGGGNAVARGNPCVPANCRVDSDCGSNGFCSPTYASPPSGGSTCAGLRGYYCHTPADECANATDCDSGQTCQYASELARWVCAIQLGCNG